MISKMLLNLLLLFELKKNFLREQHRGLMLCHVIKG